ncbi:MAG: helix-hairpin-helix domain-containing protein [Bacteroidetes bacterium]|nr:MAG: helix-hairpin-helix domain-containing protein [Bacteroidota bacterium]
MKKKKKVFFKAGWKDYLSFSSRERNGAYALILILVFLISVNYYLNFLEESSISSDNVVLPDSVLAWMILQSEKVPKAQNKVQESRFTSDEIVPLVYFKFNPNLCTVEEFQKLGLSFRQATMIVNYRSKGGVFRKKIDFKKMYCIKESEYHELEPWIELPDSESYFKPFKPLTKTLLAIDLCQADSTELEKLPGIGPAFARRIVKLRHRLGGFSHIDQLKEVWGMTDSLYHAIRPHVYLSDSLPGSIALNSVLLQDFGKHPYVGFEVGKIILSYRDQHGPFKSVDDIKKVPLVTEEIFRKLVPYLSLEIK